MREINDAEQAAIFSENLQRYIRMTGKDQKDIALELGENAPTFNQWATGKAVPKLSKIRKMANYFNVEVEDLINPVDATIELRSTESEYSSNERALLYAYRLASIDTRKAAEAVLGVKKEV